MVHLRSIYFGAHGNTEYNASLQINIVKAIFQEKQSSIPYFASLDSSDLEEEEEEEEEEEDL